MTMHSRADLRSALAMLDRLHAIAGQRGRRILERVYRRVWEKL